MTSATQNSRPYLIAEHVFPLMKEYNGYTRHPIRVHSPYAKVVFVEWTKTEKSRYLIVHVRDQGLVSEEPAWQTWVTVYQRLGEVTPLGPEPGELVRALRVDGEPHVFFVFADPVPVRIADGAKAPAVPRDGGSGEVKRPPPPSSESAGVGQELPSASAGSTAPESQVGEDLW